MVTAMSTRDAERQKTYDAEFQVRRIFETPGVMIEAYGMTFMTPEERKFARVEDIQRYVDAVLAHVGHKRPVKVRVRKGIKKAHYEHFNETIAIPESKWAMREIVVLHEIAHHLTKHSAQAHGPEFRSAFCDLLERVLSPEARFLLQCAFFERGLTA